MSVPAPRGFENRTRYAKAPARDQIADSSSVSDLVAGVLRDVRARGDAAVRQYSREFDKADLDQFEVSAADRAAAVAELDPQTRADTEFAIENVRRFAEAQLGTILPLEVEPIPGLHLGTASSPSTASGLMCRAAASRCCRRRS
jgi:histidinol dehydrogenase/sulfopropanediol 3-dehydrogenase